MTWWLGGEPNYFPNSFNGPAPLESAAWHTEASTGDVARYETGGEDNFTQCGQFFRNVLSPAERERLTDNIAGNLVNAQEFIQNRAIANFAAVSSYIILSIRLLFLFNYFQNYAIFFLKADANYGKMIKSKVDKLKKAQATTNKSKATNVSAILSPKRTIPSKSNL